jgi:hypothetical protein
LSLAFCTGAGCRELRRAAEPVSSAPGEPCVSSTLETAYVSRKSRPGSNSVAPPDQKSDNQRKAPIPAGRIGNTRATGMLDAGRSPSCRRGAGNLVGSVGVSGEPAEWERESDDNIFPVGVAP